MVTRIIRHDEHEAIRRFKQLAGTLQWQNAAVVGQRMQDHGHILARFNNLVEIADAAFAHGAGQRSINPMGVSAF
ncbi:hypothetical protein D9M69_584430 [compost metagenome]